MNSVSYNSQEAISHSICLSGDYITIILSKGFLARLHVANMSFCLKIKIASAKLYCDTETSC